MLPARCPTEYSRTEENWIQLGSHFSLAGSYFSSPAHSSLPGKHSFAEEGPWAGTRFLTARISLFFICAVEIWLEVEVIDRLAHYFLSLASRSPPLRKLPVWRRNFPHDSLFFVPKRKDCESWAGKKMSIVSCRGSLQCLAQITLPDMKNFQNLLPMVFSHDRKSTIGYCRFSSNNRVTPSGPKARRYKGCAGKCLQVLGH